MDAVATVSNAEAFRIAPGFFILNDVSLRGAPPKGDAEASEFYKVATGIKKQVFYYLAKFTVSTPFGYYADAEGRDAIMAYVNEISPAVDEMNRAHGAHFRLSINMIDVPADPSNDVLNRRLREYTVERLASLRERLATLDPKTHKTTLIYSQDSTKRLDLYCRGVYAKAVRKAIKEAGTIAATLRKDPAAGHRLKTPAIDDAIEMLGGGA